MADHRLYRMLTASEAAQGEQIFGSYELIAPGQQLSLAPIKRVAILTEAFLPKVDGVTKTAYLTLRYLQQTGREVLVFAPDIAPSHVGPSEVIALPSLGLPVAPETRMALPNPSIARHLTDFQPDLIHLFSPALMSVSGMAMGRHLNVPVIANYQTDLPGYAERYGYSLLSWPIWHWLRYIHNGCHLTLVPTRRTAAELRDHGFRRLRSWGRGVNSKRFSPDNRSDEMRRRLLNGRDPSSLLVIYVGRLAAEKRLDLLLDVARLPGVALTIVGDGAQREELEALFAGTGTHFTGYIFGDELAQVYASADVFAFAGQNETFGQVVQEAMASGLPCVVIDEGGVPDLVEQGRTGFICPPDAQAFASAVQTLRDNPVLRAGMGQRARQIAGERPWWTVMAQLEAYYHEAYNMNERFKALFGHTTYHMLIPVPSLFSQR